MEPINNIAGIDLHYARNPYAYGSQGVLTSFNVVPDFKNKLEACFEETFSACPLGKPKIITCAGIYNPNHHNPHSKHRIGRAFDLDAIFWEDHILITKKFFQNKYLYLGIESYLRRHFGIVLNYFYNEKHKDHWHFDDSISVDYRTGYKSSTLHLQLALTYVYDHPVIIDGLWGPQTENVTKEILELLGLSGKITTVSTYKAFLRKTALVAFKRFELSETPSALLNDVYEHLENTNMHMEDRNELIDALNDFRNHPSTQSMLEESESGISLEDIIDSIS